jgi:gluconate kinase
VTGARLSDEQRLDWLQLIRSEMSDHELFARSSTASAARARRLQRFRT